MPCDPNLGFFPVNYSKCVHRHMLLVLISVYHRLIHTVHLYYSTKLPIFLHMFDCIFPSIIHHKHHNNSKAERMIYIYWLYLCHTDTEKIDSLVNATVASHVFATQHLTLWEIDRSSTALLGETSPEVRSQPRRQNLLPCSSHSWNPAAKVNQQITLTR